MRMVTICVTSILRSNLLSIRYIQQLRDGVHNFFVTFIEVLRDRPPGHDWELEPGVTCGDYLFGFLQVSVFCDIFFCYFIAKDFIFSIKIVILVSSHILFDIGLICGSMKQDLRIVIFRCTLVAI